MSSLTLGLVIAGGLVLAAVVAHGAWSTRRHAPRQAQPEAPDLADGDPQRPTIEPSLDALTFDSALIPPLVTDRKPGGMDALIDVIAPIALDAPVSGDAALVAMPHTRRAGSKPFAIEGFNVQTRQWETPAAGRRYAAFQAGVQLANRTGALNEIEYSEFVMKTQAFADTVGGAPEFPEMLDEVARARELDQFASAHDAQLGLTLRTRSAAWSPGYIHQNAGRLGFVPGAMPGRMVLPVSKPGQPPLLVLGFDTQAALAEVPTLAALREITLSLDVPQVARSEQPFVRLRETASALATAMDGVVTDDDGQPISAAAMDAIGADLEGLYDTLEARDLAAGTALARRLFS